MTQSARASRTAGTIVSLRVRSSSILGRSRRSGEFSCLRSIKQRIGPIFFRHDRICKRPRNCKCRIVPAQAATAFGMIEFGHLIEDLRIVQEGLKPVGEAAGNTYHAAVVRREFGRVPVPIGGGTRAEI